MRRDTIFYTLFQRSPTLLFELLDNPPSNAADYRFESVAVKEPKFEIDGVFLPPDTDNSGTVYFCEVQFQKDERLYERLFSESFLYFYRNCNQYSDWQTVVIYPTRIMEQQRTHPYRALLDSDQVHRIYLHELEPTEQLPLGVALMVLTTVSETEAPKVARSLLKRTQQEMTEPLSNRAIMELITTILLYKFTTLSRTEVEAMLDTNITLQETRVYQEIKAEGEQWGREQEATLLVLRLLTRRLRQELPDELRSQITTLSLPQLEDLSEALLDFNTLEDLLVWLQANAV
jgi:predicted transposase/invertase (TIGR01784 family)